MASCVKKFLTNCSLIDENDEKRCSICNTGYFVDQDGVCSQTLRILNCEIYQSRDSCSSCKEKYVLSYDKKSCREQGDIFPNCLILIESVQPICSICKSGFYFVNTKCTSFKNNIENPGCFVLNEIEENQCLLCDFGYYMNDSLKCIKNPESEIVIEIPDSASISLTLYLFFLLLY